MTTIENAIEALASFMWGLPLLILLVGGGLYFFIYSRFVPIRYFGHAISILRGKYEKDLGEGEISSFQALATALSATVGMGNIAGVAVAISIGGPGAMFWMWISALIGMSTKFFTGTLSILYRGKDDQGKIQGGPMYFIEQGLGKKFKFLAVFFSVCGLVGALPVFNVNQLTQAVGTILLVPNGIEVDLTTNLIIGIILLILTASVILGGLSRIAKVTEKLVPFMVLFYFVAVLLILVVNYKVVPHYFGLIFTEALGPKFYTGEAFLGGALGGLILLGIRRGAFSNEAGIGTAPMAHGAANTKEPIREGLVAMMGPFIDTIIVCTLTALAILVTDVWQSSDANGVSLTAEAFGQALPGYGKYVLLICLAIFSISSLFSYSYYGAKCTSYLWGTANKKYYTYVYLSSILIGATTSLSMMLNLIDSFFAMMAFPTMFAALMLSPKVKDALVDYKKRMMAKKSV